MRPSFMELIVYCALAPVQEKIETKEPATDETRMEHGIESVLNPCFIRGSLFRDFGFSRRAFPPTSRSRIMGGMIHVRAMLIGIALAVGPSLAEDQANAGSVIWACVITFTLLVAAGIGFPIPEELPIIGAGIWVGHNNDLGPLRWIILPVCIAGVVISDGMLYGVGRYFGPKLLEWRAIKRLLPPQKRERIESN